jgi:hypothetical protein
VKFALSSCIVEGRIAGLKGLAWGEGRRRSALRASIRVFMFIS